MTDFSIYNNNVLDFFEQYTGPKFNFSFYDPPYEINHIGTWDKSGITYNPDLYKGLYEVLLPGAFAISYGHSRTHHRIMIGFEDAGFMLHKTLFAWIYYSGNPQGAANMQRNIDNHFAKQFGGICKCSEEDIKREGVTLHNAYILDENQNKAIPVEVCNHCSKAIRKIVTMVKWSKTTGMKKIGGPGYGNNNTQIIAEDMTPEAAMYKNHTYGLSWSKPMLEPLVVAQKPFDTKTTIEGILKYNTGVVNVREGRATARWPGDIFIAHDASCLQSDGSFDCGEDCLPTQYMKDDPNFNASIPQFQIDQTEELLQVAGNLVFDKKASQAERNAGLTGQNPHSSVKPLSVNEYIAKLFLPPAREAPRNVLVPFSGVGSEMIGLGNAGWDSVTGVEMSTNFCEVARDRIRHYHPHSKVSEHYTYQKVVT